MYEGNGFPTQYQGVTYRTRLEARWAIYLEKAGWEFVYLPPVSGCYKHTPTFLIKKDDVPVCYLYIVHSRRAAESFWFSGCTLAQSREFPVIYGVGQPRAGEISIGLSGYIPEERPRLHHMLFPLSVWKRVNYGLQNSTPSIGIDPTTKAACEAACSYSFNDEERYR